MDYVSYPPSVWGKGVWKIIFSSFENLEGEMLFIFLKEVICKNLPCIECKNHIEINLKKNVDVFNEGETNCLIFFIELYNLFYPYNKIDKRRVDFSIWLERDKKNNIGIIFL